MNPSNICKRRNCVTKLGDSGDVLDQIDEIVESFENELFTGEYSINDVGRLDNLPPETFIEIIETPVERVIRQYGETAFYTSVAAINAYFERPETVENLNAESYPLLFQRVQGPPLSVVEVADFIGAYQYSPQSLTFQSGILNTKLLSEFENFYTGNLSGSVIGSFCALMPNVFGAIDSFFTALSDIQGFIDKIRNFSLNFGANLRSLLNNLKQGILKAIDRVVENVKNIIQNLSISDVIQEVRTFVEQNVVRRFYELKEAAMSFFNELTIENIKRRVQAIIDSATRMFRNPTLEDIQYLIYRFCNLASQIENAFNYLLNPMTDFRSRLQDTISILRGRSNVNTERAILAGAIRLSPEEAARRAAQAPAVDIGPRRAARGDRPPITGEELERALAVWNNGEGIPGKIKFTSAMRVDPYTVGETIIGPASLRWTNVGSNERALLMRVQERFGQELTIVSAWRDPRQQFALYTERAAAAANIPLSEAQRRVSAGERFRTNPQTAFPGTSQHEAGKAFDIRWGNMNRGSITTFFRIAIEEGFAGSFGDYAGGFVHIDNGGSSPLIYVAARLTWADIDSLGFRLGRTLSSYRSRGLSPQGRRN